MLETILGVLTSSAGGGLLGTVGSLFKGKAEYKARKLELRHEQEMRKLDREELELEAKLRAEEIEAKGKFDVQLAELEAEAAREVNDAELRTTSYSADKASYGGGWVDKIRGIMRPVITIYLLGISTYIAVYLTAILNGLGSFGDDEALALYGTIINAIVFLTTTAVTWWFGSRPINKK